MPSPVIEKVNLALSPEEANQLRMVCAAVWSVGNTASLDAEHTKQAEFLTARLGLPDTNALRNWGNDMIVKITQALAKLPLEGT